MREQETPGRLRSTWVAAAWLLVTAAVFAVTLRAGARHDYRLYKPMWTDILTGVAPWGPHSKNFYGPLFNITALPAAVHPMLPKLCFALVWLFCAAFLMHRAGSAWGRRRWIVWGAAAFFFINPFFWVHVAVHGTFDIVPAALCLLAVDLRQRDRAVASGAVLGAGVLSKFYPLAMLPFLMLDGRRVRLRLAVACLVCIAAGMAVSLVVWGPSTFYPLSQAAGRESKMLSVFRFLRGTHSPMPWFGLTGDADHWSLPAMVVFGLAALAFCYWKRIRPVPAALAGMTVALALYKVGHAQYLAVLFLLCGYWFVQDGRRLIADRRLTVALAAYLGFVSLHSLLYVISAYASRSAWGFALPPWSVWREWAGLPGFLLAGWAVAELLRHAAGQAAPSTPAVEGTGAG